MAASNGQMHIDPGVFASIDDWDAGDVIDFEEATGILFSELETARRLKPGAEFAAPFKFVLGLAWIAARKEQPSLTFAQAKRWKLGELQAMLAPTPAAPVPLTKLERPDSNARTLGGVSIDS